MLRAWRDISLNNVQRFVERENWRLRRSKRRRGNGNRDRDGERIGISLAESGSVLWSGSKQF